MADRKDTGIPGTQSMLQSQAVRHAVKYSSARLALLLALVCAVTGYSQQSSLVGQSLRLSAARIAVDGSALAFGRYLASVQERDPFTGCGSVGVEIEAALPALAEQGSMSLVRQVGASERSEYKVVRLDGDPTVKQQVIARYLDAEQQAEALPHSTVAVTPANYKFRYVGRVEADGAAAYVFQISPKQKRTGLIQGQIWIDSATGIAVHQTGRFVKPPSVFIRRIEVTRDTALRDGLPYTRVTRVSINTRLVGRAELTITERPF